MREALLTCSLLGGSLEYCSSVGLTQFASVLQLSCVVEDCGIVSLGHGVKCLSNVEAGPSTGSHEGCEENAAWSGPIYFLVVDVVSAQPQE